MDKTKHSPKYNEIFSKCLLCGACYHACPRDINTPEMIIEARENGANIGGLANFKKLLIQKSLSSSALLPKAATAVHSVKKMADKLLPAESGLRLKLALFEKSEAHQKPGFSQSLQSSQTETGTSTAAYFPGCLANYLKQDIALASVSCLKKICGIDTISPPQQSCCGMAAYAAGNKDEAVKLAKKNIVAFSAHPFSDVPIVTSCATCYAHLRSYRELLQDDKEWKDKAESFANRVWEFTSFLLKNITPGFQFHQQKAKKKNVFYHDPCHLRFPKKNEQKIVQQPRSLLTMLPNLAISELPDGPQCCGQGGLFNIAHQEDSQAICKSMLAKLSETKAKTVITTCSGCLMQIQEGLNRHKSTIKAKHLAIFFSEYLDPAR